VIVVFIVRMVMWNVLRFKRENVVKWKSF